MGPRRSRPPSGPVVLDTDVLIWHLRGSSEAHAFLDGIPPSARLLSAIVEMELLRGSRDRSDLRRIVRFCDSAFGAIVHLSDEISRRATTLVERHALAHRMKPEDAIIAATALTTKATLATGNVRDYDFVSGLDVLAFRG